MEEINDDRVIEVANPLNGQILGFYATRPSRTSRSDQSQISDEVPHFAEKGVRKREPIPWDTRSNESCPPFT